jgi:hypothetical protein
MALKTCRSTGIYCTVMEKYLYKSPMLTNIIQRKNFWEKLIAYFSLIRHGPHRK